ncbi:MAG TPA: c-type cytochrome [Bryobacteraceae bacterium]|nr:c-type cytochrome [Bryobacteraceae bacterium]
MRGFVLGIAFTLIAAAAGGWWCLKQGYIDLSADQKPSWAEQKLAMDAIDAAADRRAPQTKNPAAPTEANIAAGAQLYLDHCAGCHGVPSNPESQFARSFYPPVPEFFKDAPDMSENQNFYITQHGIRWSGMPAWGKTLSDTQIWQTVTFLANIEKLPPAAQRVFGPRPAATPAPSQMPPGMKMDR